MYPKFLLHGHPSGSESWHKHSEFQVDVYRPGFQPQIFSILHWLRYYTWHQQFWAIQGETGQWVVAHTLVWAQRGCVRKQCRGIQGSLRFQCSISFSAPRTSTKTPTTRLRPTWLFQGPRKYKSFLWITLSKFPENHECNF